MARAPDLAAALVQGDVATLESLYRDFAPRLYAVARRLLSIEADAEECVQEVFVSLVERGQRGGVIDDLRAYLFASLRHAVALRGKKSQRIHALEARLAPSGEAASQHLDVLATSAMARATAALPAEQREVLALKIDGDLTFAEIAEVLGVSANTAASRYRYALEKLRETVKEPVP